MRSYETDHELSRLHRVAASSWVYLIHRPSQLSSGFTICFRRVPSVSILDISVIVRILQTTVKKSCWRIKLSCSGSAWIRTLSICRWKWLFNDNYRRNPVVVPWHVVRKAACLSVSARQLPDPRRVCVRVRVCLPGLPDLSAEVRSTWHDPESPRGPMWAMVDCRASTTECFPPLVPYCLF